MKAVLVFVTVCVFYVSAQVPKLCIAPTGLTGVLHEIDTRRTFSVHANWTYDAVNERVRINEGIVTNRSAERQYYDDIILFKERIMYRIDLQTRECRKVPLPEDARFYPIGVPPESRSFGQAVIGSTAAQGIYVIVDLWGGESPRGGRYFGSWTNLDCLPVQELHQLMNFNGDVLRQNFYDISIGYNPNDFIPPPNCM